MTSTDETYAAELRGLAHGVVPPMHVEHGTTARLGRRRRRRVAVVRAGAAAVVVAGVCVAVAVLPGTGPAAPVGSPPTEPGSITPVASARTVEVLPGLVATVAVAPREGGWDLGLATVDDGSRLALGALPAARLAAGEHGVQVTDRAQPQLDVAITWPTAAAPGPEWTDTGRRGGVPSTTIARSGTPQDGTSAQVLVGAVPGWMAGGRVLAWFPTRTADGYGTGHGVELPTYRDPTGSSASLFSAVFDQTRSTPDVPGVRSTVYLVAPDGTVYGPDGCTATACVPADQPDLRGLPGALVEIGARLG
jgi:hypothetical protein